MKLSEILLALAIVAGWGFNVAVGKMGVSELNPLLFLSIRFFMAGIIFLPFAKVTRSQIKYLFLIAIFLNVGHMGGVFMALRYLPASTMAVLQPLQVPLSIILSYFILKEDITAKQIIGIIVAFGGLLFMFGLPDLNLYGLIALAVGCLFWVLTQMLFKISPKFDGYSFLAYTSLISSPFLFLFSYFGENVDYQNLDFGFSGRFYFSLAFQVFAMSIAMLMWQRLVAKAGVNKTSPFTILSIVFGIIGGMILFDESLNQNLIIGAVLVMIGVGLNVVSFPKRKNKL